MSNEFQIKKITLRQLIRQRKKMYLKEQLDKKSQKVCEKLKQIIEQEKYMHIMLYYPLPDEVDVCPLFAEIQKDRCLLLPTVVGDDIIPVTFNQDSTFKEGAFHILEPENETYTGQIDLILVPGMAFDKNGNRLGRGKGFYDRFLQKQPHAQKIGVCFDFQIVENIPAEDFDQKVNFVIY